MVVDDEAKWTDNPVKNQRAMELVVFPSVGELRDYLSTAAQSGTEVFFLAIYQKMKTRPRILLLGMS